MYNLKKSKLRLLLNVGIVFTTVIVIYFMFFNDNTQADLNNNDITFLLPLKKPKEYNVWLIFTKVSQRSPLRYKFHNLLENILNISSVPLKFHIIVDNSSKQLAENEISEVVTHSNKPILYKFYDVEICARAISDIVQVMTPHFSSKPGKLLFYLYCTKLISEF